ncbi:MAG: hypothetical protein IJP13_08570 [Lachnospiraceae bacterium]|nr:hypothetical protein [Lachnospiraceae bacterium]
MSKSEDTFEKQWSREWDEITRFLNPHKPSIPKDGMYTYQKSNKEWAIHGYDIKKVPKELYGALCKLRAYESTGYQPDDIIKAMTEAEERANIIMAAVPQDVAEVKRLRKQYENRKQMFYESGKFDMAEKYAAKITEIDEALKEAVGGEEIE